jgi:hypothetical protein
MAMAQTQDSNRRLEHLLLTREISASKPAKIPASVRT